ncbi:MAG: four helix bundle protein [Acidimicrobiia bacterium]
MRDYTKLNAWRKSHQLALDVYSITAGLPSTENYGLVTQMRRAAVSIPSNIAEGAGRRTQADYRKFIDIATGSTSELEYHIRLVRDLGYVPHADTERAERTAGEIKKMLRALSNKLAPNT